MIETNWSKIHRLVEDKGTKEDIQAWLDINRDYTDLKESVKKDLQALLRLLRGREI